MRWEGLDVRGELPHCDELTFYECGFCGLQWFDPVTQASGAFYARLDKRDWYYQSIRREYGWALRDAPPRSRILEIGCGDGKFLSLATKAGHSVCGIELNPHAVAACRERSLDVVACDADQFAREHEGEFDVVCAFQVLEHVGSPAKLLQSMCKALRGNGRIIVSVPNVDSFKRHVFNCLDTPPHHVTRWRRETFIKAANTYRLNPLRVKSLPLETQHTDFYARAQVAGWAKLWPVLRGREHRIVPAVARLIQIFRLHRCLAGEGLYACLGAAWDSNETTKDDT